jgi:hypothetical protein
MTKIKRTQIAKLTNRVHELEDMVLELAQVCWPMTGTDAIGKMILRVAKARHGDD